MASYFQPHCQHHPERVLICEVVLNLCFTNAPMSFKFFQYQIEPTCPLSPAGDTSFFLPTNVNTCVGKKGWPEQIDRFECPRGGMENEFKAPVEQSSRTEPSRSNIPSSRFVINRTVFDRYQNDIHTNWRWLRLWCRLLWYRYLPRSCSSLTGWKRVPSSRPSGNSNRLADGLDYRLDSAVRFTRI